MCGILGIWSKKEWDEQYAASLKLGMESLKHRGPNHQGIKIGTTCGFGHVRLSIIDTESRSNQPFVTQDGRYTLVFNGEIYNYRLLKEKLIKEGYSFQTKSDTEVLLQLLINKGKDAISLLDGFFAFSFYDSVEKTMLLARDRMGIKPLLIYEDQDKILFSSEMNGLLAFDINKEIDNKALNNYFGLTYIPAPFSIYKNVRKLLSGQYAIVKAGKIQYSEYYTIKTTTSNWTYTQAKNEVRKRLDRSVANRMVADVPLGCFLSGGVDSSIIAALAIQKNKALKTFSVGFDHAYFNETEYAKEVADFIGSDHTVFTLTQADFKENFHFFLNAIDEPFADSSAFAVYLLAKKTKQEVTVALSGDGADELFGGYRKHYGEFKIRSMGTLKKTGVKIIATILKPFKNNRSDKLGELNRKLQKLKLGLSITAKDRYWKWCNFISDSQRKLLLLNYKKQTNFLKEIDWQDLNSVLIADQKLVLPNDMLKKVDVMSMANALEVRTPFLDHQLVDFVNSLPASYKINEKGGKMILKDAFSDLIPKSVIERSKKGFEIPIKEWLGEEIDLILKGQLFSKTYIQKQNIFEHSQIEKLHKEWNKPNFGDQIYTVWALVVFQYWWEKHFKKSKK